MVIVWTLRRRVGLVLERWWHSSRLISVRPDGSKVIVDRADDDPSTEEFTLIQYNFALFLGLSIQVYEMTLVADDSRGIDSAAKIRRRPTPI